MKLKNTEALGPGGCTRVSLRQARKFHFPAIAAFSAAAALSGCTFDASGLAAIDGRPDNLAEASRDTRGRDSRQDNRQPELPRTDRLPAFDGKADSHPEAKAGDSTGGDLPAADLHKPDSVPPCPASSTGAYNGKLYAKIPVTVGGYEFTYAGNDTKNAFFDISCGGAAIAKGAPFALYIQTAFSIPPDSKKILVTPYSAYNGYAVAQVKVEAL